MFLYNPMRLKPMDPTLFRLLSVAIFIMTTVCCSPKKEAPPVDITFVRGGIAVDGTLGQVEVKQERKLLRVRRLNLDGDRQILEFDWEPGAKYSVMVGSEDREVIAPLKPTPYLIRTIPLEAVDAAAATTAVPDSTVKFSPDGRRLAIGTLFGNLQVVDVFSGQVLWKKKIAEGMVKRVEFSPDGSAVYAGEQSPDGFLYAFDAETGAERWKLRLADDLESSMPPSPDDRYGIYFLPGVYQLRVARSGLIFAAGTHSWNVDGEWKNRARLYVLKPDGSVVWRYPEDKAMDANITTFEIDPRGSILVMATSRSATSPPSGPIKGPGVYAFDMEKKLQIWKYEFEPLEPHFKDVFIWEAVGLTADGARAVAGLGDGRAALFDASSQPIEERLIRMLELGTPVEVSGVPIATPVPYAIAGENVLFFQTADSNIPATPEASSKAPPAPHPSARTLFAIDRDGKMLWRYRGDFTPAGLWRSEDGRLLMMTTGNPYNDSRTDKHGFVLLDTSIPGTGEDKVIYTYPAEGKVFFHADLSRDGFAAAITETPAVKDDGKTIYGKYQVHIVH